MRKAKWKSALLLHGAGGGGWEWNVWRGVLQAHAIAAHAPDLQPSELGLAATDLQDYSRQACAVLLGLPRPRILIGASLGGLLAMTHAARADALILINPLPPAPWHNRLPIRMWEDVIPWQRHARLQGTRRALGDADDATALFAFRHWRDESGAALRQACAGIEVAKPECPALIVLSVQDEDVPRAIGEEIAAAWRAQRLETLASSHVGPLLGHNAAHIAAQAVAWLNRLPDSG
jgi:pimeloyl-ACP methyl ester carboxylesterase